MLLPSLLPRVSCGFTLFSLIILPAAALNPNIHHKTDPNVAHKIDYGISVASRQPGFSSVVRWTSSFAFTSAMKTPHVLNPKLHNGEY